MENNHKELVLLEDLGNIFATDTSPKKMRYGLFKCYCGKEFRTRMSADKKQYAKSCGCVNKSTTHGMYNHRLYRVWSNMSRRCNSSSSWDYQHYGGRGIKVCTRWLKVENFIDDMYPTFKEGLTIDRIDNDGDYTPSNCRWVPETIQSRNTRVLQSNNTTGYRGVVWYKRYKKFTAHITINYKNIHLGYFETAIDAATTYDNYILDNGLEHTRNFS